MIVRCATTNAGKLREFAAASTDYVTILPIDDLATIEPPEETGTTFEENAAIKARYHSGLTQDPVFVDDSGLVVDALHGEPGVYSARYAGDNATDSDNNALVLERLRGNTDRSAKFVCVIAVAENGKLLETFRGEVQGSIVDAPRGANGFGYDPLFYYEPFRGTFGEVDAERKQLVSHRGHALRKMIAFLEASSA